MNRNRQGKEITHLIKSVLIGGGCSLFIMAVGCALSAALIHAEKLPEDAITYCSWTVCAISAYAGSRLARALAKHATLPVCMAGTALLLCVMVIVRMTLHFQGGAAWPCVLIAVIAALVASAVRGGRRRRRR